MTELKNNEPKKKGLDTNSNAYTMIYAALLVIGVAVLLAFASQSLQDMQKNNIAIDKKMQILRSIGVSATADNAEEEYGKLIKNSFVINREGAQVDGDAFALELSKELKKSAAEQQFPVFEAEIDGSKKYVIALSGAGLWGPIWGYIAFNDDLSTVYGADFSHQGETPGLGAEIAKPEFSGEFVGKSIFADGEFTSIMVVKPGKAIAGIACVDGISGGTITSTAVDQMLRNTIEAGYLNYFTSNK